MTIKDFKTEIDSGVSLTRLSKLIGTLPASDKPEAGRLFQRYRSGLIVEKKQDAPVHPFWKGVMCGWFTGPIFVYKDELDQIKIDVSDLTDTEHGGELIITGTDLRIQWDVKK